MDMFEKSDEQYNSDGLFIESRQLSWLVSVLLIFVFFIFWAGYFLGQKKVVSQFAQTIEHHLPAPAKQSAVQTIEVTSPEGSSLSVHNKNSDTLLTVEENGTTGGSESVKVYKPINLVVPQERYYAQLASYDSQEEAEQLVMSLKREGVSVSLKERHATSSGSKHVWYQVVTDLFEDKEELVTLVNNVAKQEKLRDICYVCC